MAARKTIRYTDELKMRVIGDHLTGACPTQVALREKHGVGLKTLRRWVNDTELIERWRAENEGPLPVRFDELKEQAERKDPAMWMPADKAPEWPQWGREFARMAVEYLPTQATRLIDPFKLAMLFQGFAIGSPSWACWGAIGVNEGTVARWREKAEQDEEPYKSLFTTIEAAKAYGVTAKAGSMLDKPKDYKATAWLLAHRQRKDFHTQQVIETTQVERPMGEMSDERLAALAALED